jgi:hypothetical protein
VVDKIYHNPQLWVHVHPAISLNKNKTSLSKRVPKSSNKHHLPIPVSDVLNLIRLFAKEKDIFTPHFVADFDVGAIDGPKNDAAIQDKLAKAQSVGLLNVDVRQKVADKPSCSTFHSLRYQRWKCVEKCRSPG